jgi:hypothetical protein
MTTQIPSKNGHAEAEQRKSTGIDPRRAAHCCGKHQPADTTDHDPGYIAIENYGLIGNMRTCALVSLDGSIDHMCWYVRPQLTDTSIWTYTEPRLLILNVY